MISLLHRPLSVAFASKASNRAWCFSTPQHVARPAEVSKHTSVFVRFGGCVERELGCVRRVIRVPDIVYRTAVEETLLTALDSL